VNTCILNNSFGTLARNNQLSHQSIGPHGSA
jgi:hypothetical protein